MGLVIGSRGYIKMLYKLNVIFDRNNVYFEKKHSLRHSVEVQH